MSIEIYFSWIIFVIKTPTKPFISMLMSHKRGRLHLYLRHEAESITTRAPYKYVRIKCVCGWKALLYSMCINICPGHTLCNIKGVLSGRTSSVILATSKDSKVLLWKIASAVNRSERPIRNVSIYNTAHMQRVKVECSHGRVLIRDKCLSQQQNKTLLRHGALLNTKLLSAGIIPISSWGPTPYRPVS